MASDAKIKLLISSALNDAGLKASREQVDKLAQSISHANKSGSADADKLAQSIGKIGGPLEGIGKAAGGVVGKLMMVFGAFKVGWEIGQKLGDVLAMIWPWYDKYKNGLDDCEKAQRRFNQRVKESAKAFDASVEASERAYNGEISKADAAIKHITAMADAYRAAHKAKSEFFAAAEDAEMLRLQREKFEDVAILQRQGDFDAAEQVSAAYDVLEAEMKAKQQIANFDRESAAIAKSRKDDTAKIADAETRIAAAEKALTEARERRDKVEDGVFDSSTGMWKLTPEEYERQSKKADADVEKAQKNLDSAMLAAQRVLGDVRLADANDETRRVMRANLVGSANLEADRARFAYDNITEANGNAAGLSWNSYYAQRVYDESVESHKTLVAVEENTADLAAKLDQLLMIKGGN